jgi:hypothetical protein
MEPEGSLPHSQEPATYPYQKPKHVAIYCKERTLFTNKFVLTESKKTGNVSTLRRVRVTIVAVEKQ